MRPSWPEDTSFRRLDLDVEDSHCQRCCAPLHICDHRFHRFYTFDGPTELVCRLAHCSDPSCPLRSKTLSPQAELTLTLPRWILGWDVFCWIGQRRFARHWSVPQIQTELQQTYHIPLSQDALRNYLRRYQIMVAARQQDPRQLASAYRSIKSLILTIDGLQPEKGHETLYVVRELNGKRVWFAQALLSSSTDEIRALLIQARQWAEQLDLPVKLWISDKQDAFVKGIAQEFAGVPHRYCQNHFVRDLAKDTLEKDSHAKVQLRKHVRGLRAIEREVLEQRRRQEDPQELCQQEVKPTSKSAAPVAVAEPAPEDPSAKKSMSAGPDRVVKAMPGSLAPGTAREDRKDQIVLDYCAVVRGILTDNRGGPLHPAGLRMAEALVEVQESLQRNLALNRPGPAHGQLERLSRCIEKGLDQVEKEQQEVRAEVEEIAKVAATLDEKTGTRKERRARFKQLQRTYQKQGGSFFGRLGRVMLSFMVGLFVGPRAKQAEENRLRDNLELERWFRQPKGHARRIHGRAHAGTRIVEEGSTLVLVLDAHRSHPEVFASQELQEYRDAQAPEHEREALQRRKLMRKGRSKKKKGPL